MSESEPDPNLSTLMADAPDACIAQIGVARVLVQAIDGGDEDEEERLSWTVLGRRPGRGDDHLTLLGDIYTEHNGWQLGVTSVATVVYKDARVPFDPADNDAFDEHVQMLGRWVAPALWGVASTYARQLTHSLVTECDIEFPREAPKPDVHCLG